MKLKASMSIHLLAGPTAAQQDSKDYERPVAPPKAVAGIRISMLRLAIELRIESRDSIQRLWTARDIGKAYRGDPFRA